MINEGVQELSEVLQKGIQAKVYPTFEWLRQRVGSFASPELGTTPPLREDFLLTVRPKTRIEKALGWRRYEDDIAKAEAAFQTKLKEHLSTQEQLAQRKQQHDSKLALISEWEQEYQHGDDSAICGYCSLIVACCGLPHTFPSSFSTEYFDSKQLLIEYMLPAVSVVPPFSEYKWIQSKGRMDEKPRTAASIKEIYQDVIAAVALRICFEVFRAEHLEHVAAIVFNGFVNGVDPATGHDAKLYLISVQVTRERLSGIDLRRVDKLTCLRSLGAHISSRPTDMIAIEPVVDFEKDPEQRVL
jgi:restriction system protein